MSQIKITDDKTRALILEAVRAGMKPARAAEMAGVSIRTFQSWKEKARAGNDTCIEFITELTKAAAKHETTLVKALDTLAGQHDFDAIMALLKMRYGWGSETEAIIDKLLSLAEATLVPAEYQKLEQAIIDGGLDDL